MFTHATARRRHAHSSLSTRRDHSFVGAILRWLVSVTAGALVLGGTLVVAQSASAASQGPGFGTWPSSYVGWEGAFIAPDGSYIYCILPGVGNPIGSTVDAGIQQSIASNSPYGDAVVSGDAAAKINALVSGVGQGADNVTASAVAFVVKHLGNPTATYNSSGWGGRIDLNGFINWKLVRTVGSDTVAQIQARAQELLASVAEVTTGRGELVFSIDASNNASGTVTMLGTSSTGTVTLTNGVFADTGSPTRAGMRQGVAYGVRGVRPTDDGVAYKISGTGTFGSGYAAALHVWTTPGGQTAVGPGGEGSFAVTGADATSRAVTFAPQIATQVVQKYTPGGHFLDDVTFSTAVNEWPRFGAEYAVIAATAKVYKTGDEPTVAGAVPDSAEEVGTLALTSDPATGPSQQYRVESDWEYPGPGYYTAVWTITGAGQVPRTLLYLDGGEQYSWVELFGERSQIAMVPNITSESQKIVRKGGTADDVVIVKDVVPAGGAEISTAFYVIPEGATAAEACVPENLVWQSDSEHVDTVGSYPFTAPNVPAFGEYAWQHRAVDSDGQQIMVSECGIESELASAPVPTITTLAPETSPFAGLVQDTATVAGPVPADGETFITFELYTAMEGADPAESCTPDSFVGDTTAAPIVITEAGDYTSPGIRPTTAGTHYNVESLWWHDSKGGEPVLLGRGECGIPNETTEVLTPTLVTKATPQVAIGGKYQDNAIVSDLGADVKATVIFEVFHIGTGEAVACTPANLVESTSIEILGSGTFPSPTMTATAAGTQLWVATLQYTPEGATEPVVLAKGVCGEPDEITTVSTSLPRTGTDAVTVAWLAGGAGVLVLAGITVLIMRRRTPKNVEAGI